MAHHDHDAHDARISLGDNDSLKTTAAGQLVHLDDLHDFKIAEGEPDIRGWDVRGTDGNKLGEVADLLVDTAAMKVRYIEVKLDKDVANDVGRSHDLLDHHITDATMRADATLEAKDEYRTHAADAGRFVLIPIGVARLDDDADDVILDAHASKLVGIPAYSRERNDLTRDYEHEVVRVTIPQQTATESLNVAAAGAILLAEARRQRAVTTLTPGSQGGHTGR